MTVFELKSELDSGRTPVLLDVREPHELEISRMDGVVEIPLGEVPHRHHELDADADIVVICRAGVRSARAIEFLASQGFSRLRNLEGGMNHWATHIDTSLPVY